MGICLYFRYVLAPAVYGWVKARWRWLLIGTAVVVSFLLGLRQGCKPKVVSVENSNRNSAEEEAARKTREIEVAAAEQRAKIVEVAEVARREEVDEERESTRLVEVEDVAGVNAYLLATGKAQRGGP